MPAPLLVTGANGMLAADLVPLLKARGHGVIACGRDRLDVTDPASARAAIMAERPGVVIHCAAYTAVDAAETDEAGAFKVNAEGARHVAEACAEAGAAMVYVSTDYVFNGRGTRPYRVNDPTDPLGAYGRSKRAGEEAVAAALPRHYVVRTSWLYGRGGKNFVDTMRALGREKPELSVVDDQRGSPTWTVALAEAIAALIETGRFGTYHATGSGDCTWYDFAREIMRLEGIPTPVLPTTSEAFKRPAPRPAYSVLDNAALVAAGVPALPHWTDSLARYLARAAV